VHRISISLSFVVLELELELDENLFLLISHDKLNVSSYPFNDFFLNYE